MNELILIRHGESQYNAMLTDQLDSELTAKGVLQARATGKFLQEHFGHIQDFVGLTSPYLRCLQTSRIIREETGLEFRVTSGPREIMVHYEKVHVPLRQEEFPEFSWMVAWQDKHWREQESHWHFMQEDSERFIKRMNEFVSDIRSEKTLIVSHGTPVGSMYDIKLGIKKEPDVKTYVGNASISYIRNGEGIWFGKSV